MTSEPTDQICVPGWLLAWRWLPEARTRVAGRARGEVLEIGAGGGANFPFYGPDVTRIAAVEPDQKQAAKARRKASDLSIPVEVVETGAEHLPFDDDSFDTVVSKHVMCSVDDLEMALREARRVLRPDGTLRFMEHVRYRSRIGYLLQTAAVPLWSRAFGNCHPNRDIEPVITQAGFRILQIDRALGLPPVPPLIVERPQITGIASPNKT